MGHDGPVPARPNVLSSSRVPSLSADEAAAHQPGLAVVPRSRAVRCWSTAAALAGLVLSGCTTTPPTPDPDTDGATAAATTLAAALSQKDLTAVSFSGATGTAVDEQFQPLVRGMGPLRPEVTAGGVTTTDDTATATLTYRWTFPGVATPWTYDTPAELVREDGAWKARWLPALLEPSLDGSSRLSQRRLYPERGEVLGEDGDPIVTRRPVVRLGIDKTGVAASRAAASARRLARVVDVDAKAYAAEVAAAGPEAFVEAIVLRADGDTPTEAEVDSIPGALAIEDDQMLAPTREFARPILGVVGEATKDQVDASAGAVVAGDQVGLSGLQKRYDDQLRGTPGVQVVRAALPPEAGASPAPSPAATPAPDAVLHRSEATAGKPLTLTLNLGLQRLAERVLSDTEPASAIVAIRPSTGAVLAAASGPGSAEQSVATVGQYPPGSTFKVASSLALLRAGLKPTSAVRCPNTLTVNGQRFKNYSDYPSSRTGRIDLQAAVANSCNTAFIGQRDKLEQGDLAGAAASLGLGTDYDVGFPSFFGSVPEESSENARAASLIGQSKVQASPLSMAAVAASVQAGKTVIPHLVGDQQSESKADPLTKDEAEQLRQLMRAVVTEGSAGRVLGDLDGPAAIAKTGTAEYGTAEPPKTHAWMIAAQGDLAVSVFVADGQSGSATAGPLLRDYLRGAR